MGAKLKELELTIAHRHKIKPLHEENGDPTHLRVYVCLSSSFPGYSSLLFLVFASLTPVYCACSGWEGHHYSAVSN